jgi:hypothetical protein
VLWQLANGALGKAPPSLPPALVNKTGGMTLGKRKAAEAMNAYFISKFDTLRAVALTDRASESVDLAMDVTIRMVETVNLASNAASLATEAADTAGNESTQATDVPVLARDSANKFTFTFVKAGGIAKIIRGLKNTEASGIDDIPTSVISVCVISLYFDSHMPTVNVLVIFEGSARYSIGGGVMIA